MLRCSSRLVARGVLSTLVFLGLVLGLEGTLRCLGFAPESDGAGRLRLGRDLIEDTNSYEPHERRIFGLREDYRHSREHAGRYARGGSAYRGRRLTSSSSNRVRVAVVGDSCVYGTGVDVADTLPYRIERELLDRGWDESEVEVLNFGVPGYSTVQIRDLLEEVLNTVDPRIVVLYAGAWNDQNPALGRSDRELRDGILRTDWEKWLDRTAIHRALTQLVRPRPSRGAASAWRRLRNGEPPLGYRVAAEELAEEMQAMIRACRARGVVLQVVIPAHPRRTLERHPRTGSDAETIRRVALEEGVDTLDAPRLFALTPQSGESCFTDFVHLSPDGTSLLARHVSAWMLPFLGTPVSQPEPSPWRLDVVEPRILSTFGDEWFVFDMPASSLDGSLPLVLLGGAPLLDVEYRANGRVRGRTQANRAGLMDLVVLTPARTHILRRAADVRSPELYARGSVQLHVELRSREGDRALVFAARRRLARPVWSHHGASYLPEEDVRRFSELLHANDAGRILEELEATGEDLFLQALVIPHGEPEGSPMARWSPVVSVRW